MHTVWIKNQEIQYHHARKVIIGFGGPKSKQFRDGITYYMNEHNQDVAYQSGLGGVIHKKPRVWGGPALEASIITQAPLERD